MEDAVQRKKFKKKRKAKDCESLWEDLRALLIIVKLRAGHPSCGTESIVVLHFDLLVCQKAKG